MKLAWILTLGVLVAYLNVAIDANETDSAPILSSPSPLDDDQPRPSRFEISSPHYSEPDTIAHLTFGDYPCIPDCTEHEAGYEWGQDHGISDPDDCSGNTGSFIEGCRVYAEQKQTTLTAEQI
jgi:hypothetical protein